MASVAAATLTIGALLGTNACLFGRKFLLQGGVYGLKV
jgi:hypothetical protein